MVTFDVERDMKPQYKINKRRKDEKTEGEAYVATGALHNKSITYSFHLDDVTFHKSHGVK